MADELTVPGHAEFPLELKERIRRRQCAVKDQRGFAFLELAEDRSERELERARIATVAEFAIGRHTDATPIAG